MKTISRYIMTLALLLTAATGAWAQGDYLINVDFASIYDRMGTHFRCMIMNQMDPEAEIKGTLNLSVDGVSKGSFNVNDNMVDGFIAPVDAGDHTWSAVFSPDGGGSFNGNGNFTIDKLSTSIAYYGSTSINMGEGESTELEVYVAPDGTEGLSYSSSDASVASISKKEYSNDTYIIQAKATGTATITFSFAGNKNYEAAKEDKTITVTVLPAPVEVTTNKAENDTVFTEASFTMPAFDATAEYELVRDMSVQMTAKMGDGTDGLRYRVKKAEQGEGYEPADMNMLQVLALVEVYDGIEQKDLTLDQDYFCRIYKLDEQTLQPEGDGVKLYDFDFAPGLYALKAFAYDDSDYAGETAFSNTFKLFQGYEVEVAAKEFITYYRDEPLYVEDEDAVLYTISSVNGDQAVLSDRSDAMPSNTPMLVYNKSNETKVILLIPCAEPDMAITVAPEFQGTLTGTTIAASTENVTNYAFNGKAFVFVKNDLAIGANKAWLSVNTGVPSARITLVFDETTGINLTPTLSEGEGAWYDLNGRKLDKMPTKKGVYLFKGKKVVIK
ncbi:hypothetical protein L6472_02440 [Prevotella sp. E13-17]|uniref:hypothetical protein n=1 Tax=Prevotella sp. E13-17 TaxID=2913616 RepID=UPI001EDA71B4|nr:hypothetical protein [Prevotella sp. E13-17]UKK51470.1 hypothetical protein L6472_02440 [Prevotella sp. E13-17]